MITYPNLVALILTRLYEIEVMASFDKLPTSIVQAFATDIVTVHEQTKDLAFIYQRYKEFAQPTPPILSSEDLNALPANTFAIIESVILQRKTRLQRLLLEVSKDGLGLMLQIILHLYQVDHAMLINATKEALKHRHFGLIPIFEKQGILDFEVKTLKLENLAEKMASLDIYRRPIVLNDDGGSHTEDETDSLDFDTSAKTYTPNYKDALQEQVPIEEPTMPMLTMRNRRYS